MANKLGLKVIAEGIETSQQLNTLKSLHCSAGQGGLFSKPLSENGIAALLNNITSNVEAT
ncbi:MAG: EAL domain-containing protein (putative c-di-GMP-specific phosphodiesterase class I) [Colwellia sp.]|jgi:EAL domain-containing protein (putative c-di-GMP-specific phosphodiesterase class I)